MGKEYVSISTFVKSQSNHHSRTGWNISINGQEIIKIRRPRGTNDDYCAEGNSPYLNDVFLDGLAKEFQKHKGVQGRIDVAIIANYFAQDKWVLSKVRNENTYLLFER